MEGRGAVGRGAEGKGMEEGHGGEGRHQRSVGPFQLSGRRVWKGSPGLWPLARVLSACVCAVAASALCTHGITVIRVLGEVTKGGPGCQHHVPLCPVRQCLLITERREMTTATK